MATRKTQAAAQPAPTPRKAAAKQPARKKPGTGQAAPQPAAPARQAPAPAAKKPLAAKEAPPKAVKAVKAAEAVKAHPAARSDKARKPKMVRDSFTMPKAEYAVIDALKERAAKAGRPAKKSELLRAGVQLLEGLTPPALAAVLKALPAIKTGRPAKA